MKKQHHRSRTLILATAALAVAMVAAPASAATFTVTNLNGAGAGSLRQAIVDANALAGADTILFQGGLTGTITVTSSLEVTDSVTITGPGSSLLTISGNDQCPPFLLTQFGSSHTHSISGMTIRDGWSTGAGGGIYSGSNNLTLRDVVVTDNVAGGDGGGLAFYDGALTIIGSTFNNNRAENVDTGDWCMTVGDSGGGRGGGIYIEKATTVTLQNVTVTNNGARTDGGGVALYLVEATANVAVRDSLIIGNTADLSPNCGAASGGGLFALAGNVFTGVDDDTLSVTDTTISGNAASGGNAGGVFLDHLANATLSRVTISGNTAGAGDGGGIYAGTGPLLLDNVTISGNVATGRGGALAKLPVETYATTIRNSTITGNKSAGTSAGIHALSHAAITIRNSIVANSIDASNAALADLATAASASFTVAYSNIESTGTATLTDGGGNVLGVDPQLGPLANNGGATMTHLPSQAGPAYDAGDPAFVGPSASDQRGLLRVANGRVDMGSVEIGARARVRSDLNANGTSDIVLQNTSTASVAVWLMDDKVLVQGKVVANPVSDWKVVASGDLDGDSKADIIVRNQVTNAIAWWRMNGAALVSGTVIATPATNWRVVATRDFNHDDRDDLLLQNASTGAIVIWFMNGATILQGTTIGNPGVNTFAVGAGKFDGLDAIVLQNSTTGTISRWTLAGTAIISDRNIFTPDSTDWKVKSIGDYDGDGDSDLALQNITTRTVFVVLVGADGAAVDSSGVVATPVPDWAVVGGADYNGDGRGDLLLHNTSTNGIAQWQMNGTVISGGWNIGTLAGWKPLGN